MNTAPVIATRHDVAIARVSTTSKTLGAIASGAYTRTASRQPR